MKKKFQVVTLAVSMLIALHIFGNDNYSITFTQLYVGITALAIAFADIVALYGKEESK